MVGVDGRQQPSVRERAQGCGIGRLILEKCWDLLGPGITFLLVSEPEAKGFYERIGMEPAPAYFHARTDRT